MASLSLIPSVPSVLLVVLVLLVPSVARNDTQARSTEFDVNDYWPTFASPKRIGRHGSVAGEKKMVGREKKVLPWQKQVR